MCFYANGFEFPQLYHVQRNIFGSCYLANLEPKDFLEVSRLADEKQVESPTSAEICHDDGVHWHGRKEGPPWCVEFLLTHQNELLNSRCFKLNPIDIVLMYSC